jgi:tetratricopeptide (TPR) repeat protein
VKADPADAAVRLHDRAREEQAAGKLVAARATCRRALARFAALDGKSSPDVATVLDDHGLIEEELGDLATAEASFRRAKAILERIRARGGDDLARLRIQRATQTAAELAAFAAILGRTLTIFRRAYGPVHFEVAVNLHNLAAMQHARGDLRAAAATYRRALAMKTRVLGAGHPDTALTAHNLGALYTETDHRDSRVP